MNVNHLLETTMLVAGLAGTIIVGVLVWKTQSVRVWRELAEGLEAKLKIRDREIGELRELAIRQQTRIDQLDATVAELRRHDQAAVLDALTSHETRAQDRNDRVVLVLERIAHTLEGGSRQ